jgi:hypothetical protein
MSKKITLFFDNDRDNFIDKHLCKRVKPILIKESPIIPHPTLCFTNKSKYRQYLNRLSTPANIFASHIIRMYNLEIDSLDPKSGIDITHISYLINNISPKRISAIILDWDRTLTKFEGIMAIKPRCQLLLDELLISHKVQIKHIAEYYLGGRTRIKYLHTLWSWCKSNQISIYILSSNPSIGRVPLFFWDLLKSVNLPIKKKHLIYRGHLTKYQYIQQHLTHL